MIVDLVVLNYNGRHLLARCLPSIVAAAAHSQHRCRVTVVDNNSTDGSRSWLACEFPEVDVHVSTNLALCSFNHVLARLDGDVAILLNNDVELATPAVDHLVAPLVADGVSRGGSCLFAAPQCWRSDGVTYEGLRTAVRWRWGLVQATALFPGHRPGIHESGLTASAGAVLAVDRAAFVELGGFDPRYLPGRIEDLDFAYRGYLAGYHGVYVPAAVAYHIGAATFGASFGEAGCDALALRNTLLFQRKHLRHPLHVLRGMAGIGLRIAAEVVCAPFRSRARRWRLCQALRAAWRRHRAFDDEVGNQGTTQNPTRERAFFRDFHPRRILRFGASSAAVYAGDDDRGEALPSHSQEPTLVAGGPR